MRPPSLRASGLFTQFDAATVAAFSAEPRSGLDYERTASPPGHHLNGAGSQNASTIGETDGNPWNLYFTWQHCWRWRLEPRTPCLARDTSSFGAAHSVLGERYILIRLFRREDLPRLFGSARFTTRTLRFAWHLTTLSWWGFAILLVQLGQDALSPASAARTIGWVLIASGVLPLVITRGRHWAWLVLFAIGRSALAAGAA